MRKSAAQHCSFNIETVAVRKLGREVAGSAIKLINGRSGDNLHIVISLNAVDHAADGVFRPFACRHQLGVSRQDWRTAEFVFFFDQNTGPSYGSQTMRCSKPRRPTTNDKDWFSHCLFS
jgi:hypothetical protein